MCSDHRQTRRKRAARLLLFVCGICCAGIFLFQGADALRGSILTSVRVPHQEEQPVSRALPDTEGKKDINRASLEDLQRAEGIGPTLAQRILEERETRGGFHFLEELMDVSCIGQKRFEALSRLFYCAASWQDSP